MIIENGRSYFYQWDIGQRLLIEESPTEVEVHFAISPRNALDSVRCDHALVVKSYAKNGDIYVDVPNQLLQVAGKLTAYVYIETEAEGYTVMSNTFTVLPRPRPADYIYTESEIKRWEALDERIKTLEQTDGAGGTLTDGLLPVTTADNGKFMRVVDGAWAAVTVPEAEGVSF